jgi:hypothetical protein
MNTLPADLILEIATHLEFTYDIAALSQTNRALHHSLNARVYIHNCQHENGLGLERAVTLNIPTAVSSFSPTAQEANSPVQASSASSLKLQ